MKTPFEIVDGDQQEKDPGGRPTEYKATYNEQAFKLCLLGATDKELANFFNIAESTLNLWKDKHPKFMESIKAGKFEADANVGQKLYERALGYEHDTIELKVVSDGAGMGSSVEQVEIRKKYPPDVTAAIFWLKNRQPAKWRDKTEVDTTVTIKDYKVGFEDESEEPEENDEKK